VLQVVVIAAAYSAAQHQGTLKKLGVSTAAFGSHQQQQQQQQQSSLAIVSALEAVRQAEQQQQGPLHALCQQVHAAAQQLTSATDQQQQQQQQCCTVILDSVACVSALAGGDTAQVHALLQNLAALGENLQVRSRTHPCSRSNSSSLYSGERLLECVPACDAVFGWGLSHRVCSSTWQHACPLQLPHR
jgi:hypothetical protein